MRICRRLIRLTALRFDDSCRSNGDTTFEHSAFDDTGLHLPPKGGADDGNRSRAFSFDPELNPGDARRGRPGGGELAAARSTASR
jgi:hypothetical protein